MDFALACGIPIFPTSFTAQTRVTFPVEVVFPIDVGDSISALTGSFEYSNA